MKHQTIKSNQNVQQTPLKTKNIGFVEPLSHYSFLFIHSLSFWFAFYRYGFLFRRLTRYYKHIKIEWHIINYIFQIKTERQNKTKEKKITQKWKPKPTIQQTKTRINHWTFIYFCFSNTGIVVQWNKYIHIDIGGETGQHKNYESLDQSIFTINQLIDKFMFSKNQLFQS